MTRYDEEIFVTAFVIGISMLIAGVTILAICAFT